MKKLIAWFRIPRGKYCYKISHGDGIFPSYYPCPYWGKNNNKPEQQSGYCKYLKINDWEGEGYSLLWDQIKECGIKNKP